MKNLLQILQALLSGRWALSSEQASSGEAVFGKLIPKNTVCLLNVVFRFKRKHQKNWNRNLKFSVFSFRLWDQYVDFSSSLFFLSGMALLSVGISERGIILFLGGASNFPQPLISEGKRVTFPEDCLSGQC